MVNRRTFLQTIAAIAAGNFNAAVANPKHEVITENPFRLGVASGSPKTGGVVLWTRLAINDVTGFDPIPVAWEIFDDLEPRKIIAKGTELALRELGHSVHAEVNGLSPGRWYQYRFVVGNWVSPTGRTRTLPSQFEPIERLRFAYASCQRWEEGYYSAYRGMLAESLDLVIFLGDYIYESKCRANDVVRTHNLPKAVTLDDYRKRYALYKSDENLQRMHSACPWIVTWDDHEVENDYSGLDSLNGTRNFGRRRAAAYQAFYEHMPIRRSEILERSAEGINHLRLFHRFEFGSLACFHVLDGRQYRNSGYGDPASGMSPRSMLGAEQESWLRSGFQVPEEKKSIWNLICQQTAFSPRNYGALRNQKTNIDSWDGYQESRLHVLELIRSHRPKNPIFLGGDIHQNWIANVHQDPYDVASPLLAAEFCGTSISSKSGAKKKSVERIAKLNPHCLLADAERRGYNVIELSSQAARISLRVVDDITDPDSKISTLASFSVKNGSAEIIKN
jgi:alkaline phosphatase D